MEKLKIFEGNKETDFIYGVTDKFGNFIATDQCNHDHRVNSWADAMNYLNDRSGDYYYDSYEEALESWNEDLSEENKHTLEEVKEGQPSYTVAEACGGRIEIEDEDEEDDD